MMQAAMVGLGGMIGATGRWMLSEALRSVASPGGFPWATFGVNVLGCFLFGLLSCWIQEEQKLVRLFVLVGCLGGFTTYSTFGWETWALLEHDRKGLLALYVGGTVVLGLLGIWGGLQLGGGKAAS